VFDFANRALRETVGGRTVIGLPFAEALPEIAEQGAIGLLNDVYTTGEPYFGESDAVLMRRSDGVEERVLSRTVQRVRLPDGADGLLLHHTDITPTVHARREVERTLAELRAVTDELARSNEELDQFAYAASHDLKAPLRGINHLATWIRDDFGANLDPRALEYLDLIGTRIGHLEALIDGLLEYSRIGRSSLQLRPLDMDRVVSDIVDLVPTPPHVRVEIAGPLPVITADPIRIRQVVQNLLSNAVKYASARVEIRTERHPTRYGFEVFAISDDGPGIDPRYHDRIWGVFQRLEASDEGSGTGIGLALVRKIAREAGGDAWVRSTPGEGATFLFSWPRTRSDEEAA
jgi:light-regulated signal transduction histidine kinase (bacteriophytochrome)